MSEDAIDLTYLLTISADDLLHHGEDEELPPAAEAALRATDPRLDRR